MVTDEEDMTLPMTATATCLVCRTPKKGQHQPVLCWDTKGSTITVCVHQLPSWTICRMQWMRKSRGIALVLWFGNELHFTHCHWTLRSGCCSQGGWNYCQWQFGRGWHLAVLPHLHTLQTHMYSHPYPSPLQSCQRIKLKSLIHLLYISGLGN